MSTKIIRKIILLFISISICLFGYIYPADAAVTARQALINASKHYDKINDYIVNAMIYLDSPSMHIPETKVKIYYKKPDKLHVDSKGGIAIIPKNGLIMGNPVKDIINADSLNVVGNQKIDGKNCLVIRAEFNSADRTIESKIWIDVKNWLVMRISANPGYGPTVDIDLRYTLSNGKYWMPSYTKAKIAIPPMGRENHEFKSGKPQPSIAIIKFSDYIINKGIKDSIFQQKPERGRN